MTRGAEKNLLVVVRGLFVHLGSLVAKVAIKTHLTLRFVFAANKLPEARSIVAG
jgi:hypothetical protein